MQHENDYQAKQAIEQRDRRVQIESAYNGAQLKPEAADPWRNRSAGMRCQTCIWFARKEPTGLIASVKATEVGRCRRHAPTMGGYPVVYMSDWCGDHRIDENKI